ncbi:hypothetical protein CFIMG_004318RA [Ceratocystis fimbriata CBS 114723]|uniref:SGNH hydrolase-type esterase domain-containing protein n=1 Tax=Ceratocystis fimbriata CBS 114723 TaxID=1035309 RepID=A0A2C5WZD5_9PEZI|nr:hypothetical protein CFIMG_004318RA [Ceratocystis fimbriata CBS 114723]
MFTTLPGTAPRRHGQADLLSFPCPPHKSFRVLCLGDSLTSGYFDLGAGAHPYSGNLYLMLGDEFPRLDVSVDTDGQPDDFVVDGMFSLRMNLRWSEVTYDWTIVLGGTSDIAHGTSPQDIYKSLQEIWAVPLSKGKNVLALTIPEAQTSTADEVQRRDEVNRLIMQHRAEGFYAFDLHTRIPYHSLDDQSRELYWNDGLHLTEDGYDWMGGFIADELIRILKSLQARDRENASAPASSVSVPSSPHTLTPTRQCNIRPSSSVRSTASVSANDKNTRKPGDIHAAIASTSALPNTHAIPPTHGDPCLAASAVEAISSSSFSSPASSSNGSASPTYSLGSTNFPFPDASSRMNDGDGHIFLSSPSPTRPSVRGGNLRHQNTSQNHPFGHSGHGHGRSHSHGITRSGAATSIGRSHVHNGGITAVRRSKRLAKRSWDVAVAEDEPGVAARRLDSGYIMVHRKDIS